MAWSRTVAQLTADIRARADMETDDGDDEFVTDTMILGWINLAIAELVEIIIAETEELWGVPGLGITVSSTGVTSQGVDRYDLASDVFKPIGVDISYDGGVNWQTCERFPFAERNNQRSLYGNVPRYAFVGNKLMFAPTPQGVISYRYWYLPTFTPLTNGSFDFVHGWDDWVACRVAIRCLQKEESDTSALERDLALIRMRIIEGCKVRDQGAPARWADVRGMMPRPFDDEDAW